MSARPLSAWRELSSDMAGGSGSPAAGYARAAARFAAAQHLLQRARGTPLQVRTLDALPDLFFTLAEAHRARDEADRHLAKEPQDTLDDILAGHPACDVRMLRSGTFGTA